MKFAILILTALLMTAVSCSRAESASASRLESRFLNPPPAAKPQTWYHMMNGNVTTEGITCDFEALARIGIGGVQMFDAGCAIPAGPVRFNSPEWFDLIRHAVGEARRLGLEICLPNCSGWSSSGGPWNPPERAMKELTCRERRIAGPVSFSGRLERDPDDHGYYRDLAVLAFPTPPAEAVTYPDVRTVVGEDGFTFSSEKPFVARGMTFTIKYKTVNYGELPVTVETSSDGRRFEPLETYSEFLAQHGVCDRGLRRHPFPREVTARAIRVTFGKARVHCAPADPRLTAALPLSNLKSKAFFLRNELPVARDVCESRPDQTVDRRSVLNLTDRLGADGTFSWEVPSGDWTILRVGYRCNGVRNRPASAFGEGLEVDKLSAESVGRHFDEYIGRLCGRLGALAGDVAFGLNNVLVDSYEVGSQNWTDGFEDTFERRYGYSIIPWLPVFAGHLVGSVDESERFLEDFRRVIADEFASNYAGTLAERCHARGLKLSLEPYGNGPFDNLQYGEFADVPMGEYWSHALDGNFSTDDGNACVPAWVAHVWGRKIAATESFTAAALDGLPWNSGKWLTTPFSIKAQCDRIYARGVNRIIYHRFVHQPWPGDRYLPGMTMGLYGMHFDRTQTWWDFADGWIRYQTRCQSMLQEGENVADVLFYCGAEAPNQGGNPGGHRQFVENADLMMPPGYSWDICSKSAFLRLAVQDGQIVTPGGARYPLLALPPMETMGRDELDGLLALMDAGAKVCARTKPTRAPGLVGFPHADAETASLSERIWKRVIQSERPEQALALLGIGPDFAAPGMSMDGDCGLAFTHRRSREADWYFVAMPNCRPASFEASFRTSGRAPEIWDAEKGTIVRAREWRVENGRTVVRLSFPVSGSAFVVFRSAAAAAIPVEPAFCTERTIHVDGSWEVRFPHAFVPNSLAEGPDESVVFGSLTDWKDNPSGKIRYFSGTARYVKVLDGLKHSEGERLVLDLGAVHEVARVTVNGKAYPSLWKPPFEVDITAAATGGVAHIEVDVANLWPNRLIGDDRLCAEDCTWGRDGGIEGIPDWVKAGRKSPTGRVTFTTWKHWRKADSLLPSGLLGPVSVRVERRLGD
ncbi:MAG: glycosyl hydrolase [Verrucomicrobiota bacterium]|nr:glycosyl hydrolase [Verrucomicrobiota bacterium]